MKPSDSTPIEPQVRRPTFRLDASVPRYWTGGDPVLSHFANAFSILLPTYERFFIAAVAKAGREIKHAKLKEQTRLFCMQEGQHAIVHRDYNRWLVSLGYGAVPRIEKALQSVLGILERVLPSRWMLAIAAGGEHLTSFMAHDFLSFPDRWMKNCDPTMAALWRWHAAEEIEHKSVCYDAYHSVGGGRWARRICFFLILLVTVGFLIPGQFYLFWKDGLFFKPKSWFSVGVHQFGPGGFSRGLAREGFKYLRRNFHPWELRDDHLVAEWAGATHKGI